MPEPIHSFYQVLGQNLEFQPSQRGVDPARRQEDSIGFLI